MPNTKLLRAMLVVDSNASPHYWLLPHCVADFNIVREQPASAKLTGAQLQTEKLPLSVGG